MARNLLALLDEIKHYYDNYKFNRNTNVHRRNPKIIILNHIKMKKKIIIKKNLSERVDFQRDTFCSDNPFCRKAIKNKLSD